MGLEIHPVKRCRYYYFLDLTSCIFRIYQRPWPACTREHNWPVHGRRTRGKFARTRTTYTQATTTHGYQAQAVGSTGQRLSPPGPAPRRRRQPPRNLRRRTVLRRRCRALDQAMQKQNSLSLSPSGCLPVQCSGDDQALSWQAL